MIEQLLGLFEEEGFSLQITLDVGKNAKVKSNNIEVEAATLVEALELLEFKIFRKHHYNF